MVYIVLKMEDLQKRVNGAVKKQYDDLERNDLRKMQYATFKCSAACCENPSFTEDDVQRCIERCSQGYLNCNNSMQTELESFSNRLQRCTMDCTDQIKDKLGANPSEGDVMKHRPELEACATKCADSHIALLPKIFARIRADVKNNTKLT